jgi:adenosylhomocysteine nucleosidase
MYAILSAVEEESESFIKNTKIKSIEYWNHYKFTIGEFGKSECVITHTGVGKVNAAVVTTHIIDKYKPAAVFFTGIAGALRPDLNIGDVIIAVDCVQWDIDATAFGFKIGELSTGNNESRNRKDCRTARFYETDPELLARAVTWKPGGFTVRTGRILTGDSFIDSEFRKQKQDLLTEFKGDAVEMEGSAAAAAAKIQGVPFFLARVISDTFDGTRPKSFRRFTARASKKMADLIEAILIDFP